VQIKTIVVDFSATKISTAQPPIVGPERYEDIKATDGCDAANNFIVGLITVWFLWHTGSVCHYLCIPEY